MFHEGDLSPATRFVFTNAVHFKGLWKYPFDVADTMPMDFVVRPNDKIVVPMMCIRDERISWDCRGTDQFRVLELPYQEKNVVMDIIVPTKTSLSDFEQSLDAKWLADMLKYLRPCRLELICLPRFKVQFNSYLKEHLVAMGMRQTFAGDCDFSGIGPGGPIVNVVHKACVQVDEKGTEAAAATGGWRNVSFPGRFIVDRPFLFLIRDKSTGTILFVGRVVNPLS